MKVKCPNCGKSVAVNGLGRKPLNIPFNNISEALQVYQDVNTAAEKLGCSIGYIYQELGKIGLKPRDLISKQFNSLLR
jgi:hypothetical protein